METNRRERAGSPPSRSRQRRPAAAAGATAGATGGGDSTSYLKARTALTVYQAQERQLAIQRKKGQLVDRARAELMVFRLARQERDAWITWPARVARPPQPFRAKQFNETTQSWPPWTSSRATSSASLN